MKISTKGRYSVTALYELAQRYGEGPVSLKCVAQGQGLSENYLEQLMVPLRRAGIVQSIRGAQGGYMLARTPDRYTVGEVLRLTEGTLAPVACAEQSPVLCDRSADCATLPVWRGLSRVINEDLDSVTLQDILDQERERAANDYVI